MRESKNKAKPYFRVSTFLVEDFDQDDNEATLLDKKVGFPCIIFLDKPVVVGEEYQIGLLDNPAINPLGARGEVLSQTSD